MKYPMFKLDPLCVAITLSVGAGTAFAQERVLEEVFVTGVAGATSELDSFSSVTSMSAEEVLESAPRSTAEVFRSIPGIQVEPSSGDANANIKVRGMPISAGGSRYISLQEDGFPVLLVGDAAFATADSWMRFDTTVGSVQSIRGGTASTLAWNAPGGIINFISKTGEQEGGSVTFSGGLDYESVRMDADYGGSIGDGWEYYVGGFYRDGDGVRDNGANGGTENGGQIKANIGKEFERGSVRFYFKHLDDEVPTYLPIPAEYKGGTNFKELGVDFSDGNLFLDTKDCAPRRGNNISCESGDSFKSKMTSLAFDGTYDLNEIYSTNFKYRYAEIDGNFASPFPGSVYDGGAAGPSTTIVYFNTQANDEDNNFASLTFSAEYELVQATVGLDYVQQNLVTTWNFNEYYRRLDSKLTPFDQGDSVDGVLYGNPLFGNCCTRSYDFEIDGTAPWIALSGDIGENLRWEGSYRKNYFEVDGNFAESTVLIPLDVNRDGTIGQNEQLVPTIGAYSEADYDIDYDAWSVGLNYAIGEDMAVFANVSEGGSMSSPDRVTANLQSNGDMPNDSGWNKVEQAELGFKYSGDNSAFYITYFNAVTTESREFEVTTRTFKENKYEAQGVEVEGHYDFGNGFGIRANATWTDSEIDKTPDTAIQGNTPRRQPDYIFNIAPYYVAANWDAGLSIFGSDEVYVQDINDLKFDSYITTALFANYSFSENLSVGLNVNNLFDEEAFTEGEEGSAVPGDFVRIRPINGRSTSLSLRYTF